MAETTDSQNKHHVCKAIYKTMSTCLPLLSHAKLYANLLQVKKTKNQLNHVIKNPNKYHLPKLYISHCVSSVNNNQVPTPQSFLSNFTLTRLYFLPR